MSAESPAYIDASIPELMRIARGSYRQAIDKQLSKRGINDLPRNGAFALGRLARGTESIDELIDGLGVTRQSFSELVDVLVTKGYVSRETHPDDRRRMRLVLTERGEVAAKAIVAGTRVVDRQLASRLTDSELAGLRRGLAVLGEIKSNAAAQRR